MTRRHGLFLSSLLFLGLVGLLLACDSRSRSTAASTPPAPEVEYEGCWAVYLPGPVCALKPGGKFSLWVKSDPDRKVEIRAGDRPEKVAGEEIDAGRRFDLALPPDVSPLTVRLCQPKGACGPSWSLLLAPPEMPQWFAAIQKLQEGGRNQEIREQLQRLRGSVPAREKGLVFRQLAYLARDQAEAAEYLDQGIAADRAVGNLKGEVEKATWLARLDIDQARFSRARQRLAALPLPPAAPAIAKYQVAYYRGLLGARVGDYRSALEQLRRAAELAEDVGLRPDFRWKAEQVLAGVLQSVGRSQEASELFARLHAHPRPGPDQPCDLGELLSNEAWSRLIAREAGENTADPIPILEEARSEFDQHECKAEQRLNARINLALAHLQAGHGSEAGRALEDARGLAANATPHLRLWWLDLEARAVLDRRPARALRLYDELAGEAERDLSLDGRFRAAVGRARAHRALGQRAAALADFAQADRLIDEQSRHVPVHEGRDTLLGQRGTATREYLELLLSAGQAQHAFDLVRRDRSRLLRQLAFRDRLTRLKPAEQQEWDQALSGYRALRESIDREAAQQWQLPLDQVSQAKERHAAQLARAQQDLDRAVEGLGAFGTGSFSPPGKDEVILAYHPLPRGWVGFAAHERGVEVSRFEMDAGLPADPQVLARLLLAPFQQVIEPAGRLRVLSYGGLRSVDFHALPFGGEPLLARHLVVYSLDLPARPAPPPAGRLVALLVSNPQTDQGYLPAAQKEAGEVAAAVGHWEGWTLQWLQGPGASSPAVSAALPRADLFHFAGHGSFAGFSGWDSALPLADRSLLTLGDVLTLRRVPRWVVLSACDAGLSSEQAPGEGIGLANAFLLAGAQKVVAANRRIADDTARDLLSELYRGWRPGTDLSRQLQRAELACRQRHPKADCASFRLLEP